MRQLKASLFAAVLLIGAAPGAIAAASGPTVDATVTGTPSADTLDLQLDGGTTQRVQLVGIVTDAQDGSPACSTAGASAQEEQLLAQGPVTFEPADVQPPTTGADAVGYVWLADGRNLGEVLLRQGQARSLPDPPHARSQEFAAAQAEAIADQVGIWAPSVCASATDTSTTRASMGGFVVSSLNAVQQARLGIQVLRQQVASAPEVGSTPAWQRTTAMAIGWTRDASHMFQSNAARSDPAEPERMELASLGQQLDGVASAAEAAAAAGDNTQLQALGPRLDAAEGGLNSVAAELSGLAVAYTLGD